MSQELKGKTVELMTHNSVLWFSYTQTFYHIGPEKVTGEEPWVGFRIMHLVHPYYQP